MYTNDEIKILNLIAQKESIAQLATEMPEDCLQYIVDMIAPPFPVETQEDRELMTFMYISSLIRYIYVEHEGRDENGRFIYMPELFWMLETVYDNMPQYRTSRFYQAKEATPQNIKVEPFVF